MFRVSPVIGSLLLGLTELNEQQSFSLKSFRASNQEILVLQSFVSLVCIIFCFK